MDWIYQYNLGELSGIAVTASIFLLSSFPFFLKSSFPTKQLPKEKQDLEAPLAEETKPVEKVKTPRIPFKERLYRGLGRSRQEIWGKLFSQGILDETLDEIEELLYSSDMGAALVEELLEKIKELKKDQDPKEEIYQFLWEKLARVQNESTSELFNFNSAEKRTRVIMIVGVNGAGKTTTIGKLATKLTGQGAKVYVGACDTFRAAAVDQLETWCDRAGATMIRAKEGNDPSGVAYMTLEQARKNNADYCILDTAGRLHTKVNLMEELKKSKRVLSKIDADAPHETLLVIDSITGQNAIAQAKEFNATLGLTGLIFTKCDGTSKAGNAISIVDNLSIPIQFIGVGEKVEDLDIFCPKDYLNALLGRGSV